MEYLFNITKIHLGIEHILALNQGTIDCASLLAGLGESGDPGRKWEKMGERAPLILVAHAAHGVSVKFFN